MLYIRFSLSLLNVEDLLHSRGKRRATRPNRSGRAKISYQTLLGSEGSLGLKGSLEAREPLRRPRKRRRFDARPIPSATVLKRHGRPENMVTDGLRTYGAALKEIGAEDRQVTGRWANNRVENSHQPFRRRERAMLRFRRMHSLQRFAAVYSSIHNLFDTERSLSSRDVYKLNRAAALAEWRALCTD